MGNKIRKTTGIFDDVDHSKSRWVTYWAERIGPLVDHINQFSCCVAFGAFKKTTCYSLNISRLAACIWIIFFNLKGMKWGYVSYHFLHCYINYCILYNKKAKTKKKPKKAEATLWPIPSDQNVTPWFLECFSKRGAKP